MTSDTDVFLAQFRMAGREHRPAGRVLQLETGMEITFGCRPIEDRARPEPGTGAEEPAVAVG